MFTEDDLLPISALQHLIYCERQFALIHIERLWVENRFTVEGKHLHERAHEETGEHRPGIRIARSVPLRSTKLGLVGITDIVEFHEATPDSKETASQEIPFPIEYKRGRPKPHQADRVQLCAQALCLEEMLHVDVPQGALFYGLTRRRELVALDVRLRTLTIKTAAHLHELFTARHTPIARKEPKCKRCSMIDLCMPQAVGGSRSALRYLKLAIAAPSNQE